MEIDVKQRIRLILEKNNSNPNQLAKKYSLNQKTLNNQINSDVQMSLSTILLILNEFSDVSSEWLLWGKGPMYKSEYAIQKLSQIGEDSSNLSMNVFIRVIDDYQKKIDTLIENLNALKEENEKLRIEIEKKKAVGE